MNTQFTENDWVRITTNAYKFYQQQNDLLWIEICKRPSPIPNVKEQNKFIEIKTRYQETILDAWNKFRPNGPLENEIIPYEIQKIIEQQNK